MYVSVVIGKHSDTGNVPRGRNEQNYMIFLVMGFMDMSYKPSQGVEVFLAANSSFTPSARGSYSSDNWHFFSQGYHLSGPVRMRYIAARRFRMYTIMFEAMSTIEGASM